MHNTLLRYASEKQLRDYLSEILSKLKDFDKEMYEELEWDFYKELYGCHFNEWLLEDATSHMVNEDGSRGPHWRVEQTNSVAKSLGVSFIDFNEYDFNYVMNMLYSDFYGCINSDTSTCGKMAKAFLEDKDAPKGKALKYYIAMKE